MDAFQDCVRIEIECVRHVTDPLRPEGLLGNDPDRVPVHPAVVLRATFVPISAASATIVGEATACPMRSVNPASFSFSAVAGPTPDSSSIDLMALTATATLSPFFSSLAILKAVTQGGG